MINFYDFEVFKHDWMVVIINPASHDVTKIVNDAEKLAEIYEQRKNEIWVGYNNAHYDQYIFKAILLGIPPKRVNDYIIKEGGKGYGFSSAFRNVPMINYDVFHPRVDRGLKTHEAYLGNDIRETSVPFDIDRKLTQSEINDTLKYCTHDVEQTMEVFLNRQSEFNARMDLLKMFDLPLSYLSKTDAQLTAIILGANQPARPRNDEFELDILPCLQLGEYSYIANWYVTQSKKRDYEATLDFDISNCPHKCAWGGLHGALPRYSATGYFINMDVASYYPSMMIEHGFLSRNVSDAAKFEDIRETRFKLKAEGDSKHKALKLVLNGTFGASKDKYNALYDPKQANNVCVNGQLMLIDLMQHLTNAGAKIIQSNTDGVLVKMPNDFEGGEDAFFDTVDDVASEWENRTGMTLEFDEYQRVYQKDVNNYIFVDFEGKAKTKGAYVKQLNDLDCDLAIINKAMVAYMVDNIPVAKTILECDTLKDFQRVVKISSKYDYGLHGSKRLQDKTFRVFASNDEKDGGIYKVKRGFITQKFGNTSENVFIENGNINGAKCPEKLNKQWYIELAEKRLMQFGVK